MRKAKNPLESYPLGYHGLSLSVEHPSQTYHLSHMKSRYKRLIRGSLVSIIRINFRCEDVVFWSGCVSIERLVSSRLHGPPGWLRRTFASRFHIHRGLEVRKTLIEDVMLQDPLSHFNTTLYEANFFWFGFFWYFFWYLWWCRFVKIMPNISCVVIKFVYWISFGWCLNPFFSFFWWCFFG